VQTSLAVKGISQLVFVSEDHTSGHTSVPRTTGACWNTIIFYNSGGRLFVDTTEYNEYGANYTIRIARGLDIYLSHYDRFPYQVSTT